MDKYLEINKEEDKSMDDFIKKLKELIDENPSQTRELKCPYCGDNLKFLEPSGAKYCEKCNKCFGGDPNTVGEEIEYQEPTDGIKY